MSDKQNEYVYLILSSITSEKHEKMRDLGSYKEDWMCKITSGEQRKCIMVSGNFLFNILILYILFSTYHISPYTGMFVLMTYIWSVGKLILQLSLVLFHNVAQLDVILGPI